MTEMGWEAAVSLCAPRRKPGPISRQRNWAPAFAGVHISYVRKRSFPAIAPFEPTCPNIVSSWIR